MLQIYPGLQKLKRITQLGVCRSYYLSHFLENFLKKSEYHQFFDDFFFLFTRSGHT